MGPKKIACRARKEMPAPYSSHSRVKVAKRISFVDVFPFIGKVATSIREGAQRKGFQSFKEMSGVPPSLFIPLGGRRGRGRIPSFKKVEAIGQLGGGRQKIRQNQFFSKTRTDHLQ